MKRTPLNRQSKKQAKRERELTKLPKPDMCELCHMNRATDWHHIVHRSQGGQDEPENLICICRMCHRGFHGG